MSLLQPLRLDVAAIDASPFPLDLDLVKDHCSIDGTDTDVLLQAYMEAAISWAEGSMHRTIYRRSHTWVLRDFPRDARQEILLPRGFTRSVSSIAYVSNGATVTLTGPSSGSPGGDDYQEDLNSEDGGLLMPNRSNTWPPVDYDAVAPVTITFEAGYDTDAVPASITHGLLFAVSDMYDTRGSADLTVFGKNLTTREALISPYKLSRWY